MKKRIWIVFICLCLAGCSKLQSKPEQNNTVTFTPSESPASISTVTVTSTATTTPTVTMTPTITPTSTPEFQVIHENIPIETDISGRPLQGRILLKGTFLSVVKYYPSYIWDLDTNRKVYLNRNNNLSFGAIISPDRKHIAVALNQAHTFSKQNLQIFDNNGVLISNENITYKHWGSLLGWYDNQNVFFNNYFYGDEGYTIEPLIIYDPITYKVINEISTTEFPNAPAFNVFGYFQMYKLNPVFSPDFRYAVYYIYNNQVKFYDSVEKNIITTLDPGLYGGPPQWSEDGTRFYLDMKANYADTGIYEEILGEDLFQINMDGSVEQLSNLSEKFDYVEIISFQVSPNNQYISMWIDINDSLFHLALVDTETKRLRIFDNMVFDPSVVDRVYMPNPYSCEWSPDSNQVLISIHPSGEACSTILYNLETNTAVILADNAAPVGWLYDDTP